MTSEAGTGDPRRSMELLWGRAAPPRRGPKPGLALPDLVAAAVALADEEGLAAVSMRRVGERLGTSAMSLYTYVPGKAELVDLMLDAVYGEVPVDQHAGDDWRRASEDAARAMWDLYLRHPWALQAAGSRAVLGPHEFDLYERQLRPFDGLGLTAVEVARCANAVGGFVWGAAKALADARNAAKLTGVSDEDWWAARSPFLEELAGPDWDARYPTLAKLGAQQAFDQLDRPDDTTPYLEQDAVDTFEFGLARLLDGIAALVAERAADPVG